MAVDVEPIAKRGADRARHAHREARVPEISPTLWRWFTWYAGRLLARRFHAVRLDRDGFDPTRGAPGQPDPGDEPLVVCMNHPSWWDPMVAIFLASHAWPARRHYGPIDARMLEKYGFFRKLGFFGVDHRAGPRAAAADFVRTSAAALAQPRGTLWVTAEGEFADVRRRPLRLKPGVAHVARRLPGAVVLPLAIEYTFWAESTPEVLLRFGRPLSASGEGGGGPVRDWHRRLEAQLESEMDRLASRAAMRDPANFRTLIGGASGTSPAYDGWRWLRARLAGRPFERAHVPESPSLDRGVGTRDDARTAREPHR